MRASDAVGFSSNKYRRRPRCKACETAVFLVVVLLAKQKLSLKTTRTVTKRREYTTRARIFGAFLDVHSQRGKCFEECEEKQPKTGGKRFADNIRANSRGIL
jgi:hypothetical protein